MNPNLNTIVCGSANFTESFSKHDKPVFQLFSSPLEKLQLFIKTHTPLSKQGPLTLFWRLGAAALTYRFLAVLL
jgi:hypothetical protein